MALTSYDRGGLTFDVTDFGPEDGIPVVLLHGFPADRHCWAAMSAHLTAAGLRTLAPDQRGYSPRARPAGRSAYAVPELVADVVALLDAAGLERAHLVGHDWGGAVAWAAAGSHRDRFATLTVLSTPHPAALLRAYLDPWQALHSSYMLWFQVPVLPELLFAPMFRVALVRSGLPPEIAERYLARMAAPGALAGALAWYRALPLSGRAIHRTRIPTTYLWGRDDPALGRQAAEATRAMVEADYRFVEVAEGHWLPERAAGVCAGEVVARVTGKDPHRS
jgi:pimeloyl-ACP methyl ester carboxylesterase